MPKRFGRNQKRKMRAQIEHWQEAHKRESELASYLRYKGQRDAETVERVADVLGEHFAALDPKTVTADRLRRYLRLPAVRSSIMNVHYGIDRCEQVMTVLDELETHWMKLKGDVLTGQQFVILSSPEGDMGYALSSGQVVTRHADDLAKEVAHAMSHHLAIAFRKLGAK